MSLSSEQYGEFTLVTDYHAPGYWCGYVAHGSATAIPYEVKFPGVRVDFSARDFPKFGLKKDTVLTGFDTAHRGSVNTGPDGKRGMDCSCPGVPSVSWNRSKVIRTLKTLADQC